MAQVFGDLRPDATYGEKVVLDLLKRLDDGYLVWPELTVADRHPDFILFHPALGILIIEVKDWVQVQQANPERLVILTREGQQLDMPNPAKTARDMAFTLVRKLEGEPHLRRADERSPGRLRVPWATCVIFANLTRMFAGAVETVMADTLILFQEDLRDSSDFERRIRAYPWRFPCDLEPRHVDLVRRAVYPELTIAFAGGDGRMTLGTVDPQQELAAREGLFEQPPAEETQLPEGGRRAASSMRVRLVRGVAGSGKTLVLVLRAKYLARAHPDWRVLVVTYNRNLSENLRHHFDDLQGRVQVGTFHSLCQQVLSHHGLWHTGPIRSEERDQRLAAARQTAAEAARFDLAFLSEEIDWIKDQGLASREAYLDAARAGRRKALSREERQVVYDVFRAYQDRLVAMRLYDWQDIPAMALTVLDERGVEPFGYDAVLIDEAQDFAPVWFDLLRRVLNPRTGAMFMAADGAQRIYRSYSWRSLGLDVIGRSRVLRHSYRNTVEITRLAQGLLDAAPGIAAELAADGEELSPPAGDDRWLRHGPRPRLGGFNNARAETNWIVHKLTELLQKSYRPEEIALFHFDNAGAHDYADALAKYFAVHLLSDRGRADRPALSVGTMATAKGLEFRAVFVLRLDRLFIGIDSRRPADERQREEAKRYRLLYVAMTRAREQLFMTYHYPLPPQLQGFNGPLKSLADPG
jgi:hypothetical protein